MPIKVTCSVRDLHDNLTEIIDDHSLGHKQVMVEMNGHARPIKGIRIDEIKLPDGTIDKYVVIAAREFDTN